MKCLKDKYAVSKQSDRKDEGEKKNSVYVRDFIPDNLYKLNSIT